MTVVKIVWMYEDPPSLWIVNSVEESPSFLSLKGRKGDYVHLIPVHRIHHVVVFRNVQIDGAEELPRF